MKTNDWPLFGHDGKPSVRQIIGVISFSFAVRFGFDGLAHEAVTWENFIPMMICMVFGGFMFGIVSWSNIKMVLAASKGCR